MFCPMPIATVEEFAFWNVSERPACHEIEQSASALTTQQSSLRLGKTTYQLTRPVNVCWMPAEQGWLCYIQDLIGHVGRGATRQQAFHELKAQIHAGFQTLQRKRPFEMSGSERDRWLSLTSLIDLLHYRTTTPVTTRELGQVSFGRIARPFRIKWVSGQNYLIDVEKVPGELMSCAPGQWVEAAVARDPVSHSILAIESIRKISFRLPSGAELRSIWDNMPKAELESSEWTW